MKNGIFLSILLRRVASILFKCKGKIIGILVSYHAGNLSTLNISLYKQVFCFFQTFPDDVTVTAFSGTGLKYARQISRGDEQL